MVKLKRLFLLLVLLVFISPLEGCLFIPTFGDEVFGKRIKHDQLQFIELGVTTKKEILERLGLEYYFCADENIMVYSWRMRVAVVPWMIAGGYSMTGGIEEIWTKYDLFIQLDEYDRVRRFERKQNESGKGILNRIQDWLQEVEEGRHNVTQKGVIEMYANIVLRSGFKGGMKTAISHHTLYRALQITALFP